MEKLRLRKEANKAKIEADTHFRLRRALCESTWVNLLFFNQATCATTGETL
jgi:hypothetical protein